MFPVHVISNEVEFYENRLALEERAIFNSWYVFQIYNSPHQSLIVVQLSNEAKLSEFEINERKTICSHFDQGLCFEMDAHSEPFNPNLQPTRGCRS